MMQFEKITPHPALDDFIECYIYAVLDFAYSPNMFFEDNFFPTHKQLMLIDLDDVVSLKKANDKKFSKREGIVIPGTHLQNTIIRFGNAYRRSICVCFRPGALHRFLRLPMHEMVNRDYSGGELFGKISRELYERLKNATHKAELWPIMNQYFLSLQSKLKPINKIDILIREIESGLFIPSGIDEVSARINTGIRQTERLFKQRLGVGPKTYFRLRRFSNAQMLKQVNPKMSWTRIAYEAGYYDQMHLIKDFKEFTSITPSVIQKCPGQNWLTEAETPRNISRL